MDRESPPESRRVSARRVALALLFLAPFGITGAAACDETSRGTLNLVTGPDDAFSENPKPKKLVIQLLTEGGTLETLADASLPADGPIDLPAQNGEVVESYRVTAYDDAGDAVAFGQTLPIFLDDLGGTALDLFVQRTGQFSRLPGGDGGSAATLPQVYSKPILSTLFDQYLFISTPGEQYDGSTALYDMFSWQLLPAPPSLPFPPQSIVFVNNYDPTDANYEASGPASAVLDIGADGAAWSALDFDAAPLAADAPTGESFVNVAGGQAILDPADGTVFVVGGTRMTGQPTASVLKVSPNGALSFVHLLSRRLGAAAAYVSGLGVVVIGGQSPPDGGSGSGGIEYLQEDNPVGTAVLGPADTFKGAGAIGFASQAMLVVGGVDATGEPGGVRLITFSPSTSIMGSTQASTQRWSAPETFEFAQAFTLPDPTSALVLGSAPDGGTTAYTITGISPDAGQVTTAPLPLRVSRANARAIVLPGGSLGVVGGDYTMESYIP